MLTRPKPSRSRRASSSAGFTLVELLTVITLLATLSAMAAPAMVGMMVRHRVDILRSELMQSMQQARSEAMARGMVLAAHGFVLSAHTMVDGAVSSEALDAELRTVLTRGLA